LGDRRGSRQDGRGAGAGDRPEQPALTASAAGISPQGRAGHGRGPACSRPRALRGSRALCLCRPPPARGARARVHLTAVCCLRSPSSFPRRRPPSRRTADRHRVAVFDHPTAKRGDLLARPPMLQPSRRAALAMAMASIGSDFPEVRSPARLSPSSSAAPGLPARRRRPGNAPDRRRRDGSPRSPRSALRRAPGDRVGGLPRRDHHVVFDVADAPRKRRPVCVRLWVSAPITIIRTSLRLVVTNGRTHGRRSSLGRLPRSYQVRPWILGRWRATQRGWSVHSDDCRHKGQPVTARGSTGPVGCRPQPRGESDSEPDIALPLAGRAQQGADGKHRSIRDLEGGW
jgi:hypothetical protein